MSEFREAGFDLTFPVKPEAAIAWAEARGIVLPVEFYAFLDELAGQAFTVSYLTTLDEIQAILDSLVSALDEGQSFSDWKKKAANTVIGLTPAHQETIFRNAMQQSYSAGRWLQFEQTKTQRPYLLFDGVNDSRQTSICRHLDGLIRPVDDPIWASRSPQLHHNCRSVLISLTATQAERRSAQPGTGTQKPVPSDMPSQGWGKRPDKKQLSTLDQLLQKRLERQPPVIAETIKPIMEEKKNELSGIELLRKRATELKERKMAEITDKVELLKNSPIGTEINGFTITNEARRKRYIEHAQRNIEALKKMRPENVMESIDYFLSDYE